MFKQRYLALETRVSHYLKGRSVILLRYSMALIYFWYGALKIFQISPVEELIYRATNWVGTPYFEEFLGVWEVLIGVFLMTKKYRRWALILLFAQFPGTFLPLFTNPEDCFTIIPFGLTLEGQYVFKNLILISAGLVLISALHMREETPNS